MSGDPPTPVSTGPRAVRALARLREAKESARKIAALTAYDYPTARLLDEAGIDLILVGDSLGMVVLGHEDTTEVTMADVLHHTRAANRGVKEALLVADLPYQSFQTPESAVANARELAGAGADAVKLEGGTSHVAQVRAIVEAGIPVMGHVGMLPQSVREEGGYRKKGKTPEQAEAIHRDARDLAAVGVFAMILESIVPSVAASITGDLPASVPSIGIGAGRGCDGQVLVLTDLIGSFPWFVPPFATPRADVAGETTRSVKEYIEEVREG